MKVGDGATTSVVICDLFFILVSVLGCSIRCIVYSIVDFYVRSVFFLNIYSISYMQYILS